MSKLVFGVLAVFIALNVAFAQGNESVTLPDYSDWEISLEHGEAFLYKGEPVSLLDKHYESENMITVVFYHPETGKEWIALHAVYSENGRKDYLFEKNGEKWDFFKDVTEVDDLGPILKERYDLFFNEPY